MKLQELFEDEKPSGKIPFEKTKEIEDMIKRGAKTEDRVWSSALDLVHYVYSAQKVERPTPDMSEAWKQYEEFIDLAVNELAKEKGVDGSWRMSPSPKAN